MGSSYLSSRARRDFTTTYVIREQIETSEQQRMPLQTPSPTSLYTTAERLLVSTAAKEQFF